MLIYVFKVIFNKLYLKSFNITYKKLSKKLIILPFSHKIFLKLILKLISSEYLLIFPSYY